MIIKMDTKFGDQTLDQLMRRSRLKKIWDDKDDRTNEKASNQLSYFSCLF